MEHIIDWMQLRLGLSPALLEIIILPLLAVLLLWLMREVIHLVAWRFVLSPERRRVWRQVSFYLVLLAGLAIFGGVWLRSIRRIATLVGAQTSAEANQVESLLLSVLYAIFATAVFLVLLRLIWLGHRVAVGRLTRWCEVAPDVKLQKAVLLTQERIRDLAIIGLRVLRGVLVLGLLYFYIPLILSFFPLTKAWGGLLLDWVLASAAGIGNAVLEYLPNLISLILILLVVRYIMKFVRFLMVGVGKGDIVLPGFDPEWADPTYKLGRVVAGLLTMVICYPLLPGAGSQVFQGFSIFVGALVTFGSTGVMGNVISGIVLTYTKSFRVGDRIQIGETIGDVLEKTLFVTRLRTIKNEVVTVPNGVVLGGRILNFSQEADEKGLILSTAVGIGYDVDWRRVHELMLGAARKTEAVLDDPVPFVWQKDLGDFAVTYELNVFTRSPKRIGQIYSELKQHVLDAFNEAGIEIMTPAVSALRDANQPAIPAEYNPRITDFPGFRILDPEPGRKGSK